MAVGGDGSTRLMDLKIDFAFKQLFGKVGNEPILLAFLNAALQSTQEKRIMSVEILNPEMQREHMEDKASVLDIHARTEQGEHINIEIQLANKFDMEKWRQGTVNPHENALVRWLLLLEADDHEEIRKELEAIAMKDPVMKQAFHEWEDMSRDMKKWVEYESRRKAILDEMAAVIEARDRGFAEGREEGRAVGREEGRAEGRAEGLAEGERQKAIEIAREMLAEGDSPERVARLTKLSLEEIEKLKQQLHY